MNNTSTALMLILTFTKTVFKLTLWLCSGQIDPEKVFFFFENISEHYCIGLKLTDFVHIGYKYLSFIY